jgi:glycosyltransferase involved in cell wall biosynthesis
MKKSNISICIKTHNNPVMLQRLVESIRKYQDQEYEICISTDVPGQNEQSIPYIVDLMKNDKNVRFGYSDPGFAHNQNNSVKLATKEWVWLWDDDYYVTSQFNMGFELTDKKMVYSNLLLEPGNREVSPFLVKFNAGKSIDTFSEEKLERFVKESIPFGQTKTIHTIIDEVNYPVLLSKELYTVVGGTDVLFNRAYANDPDLWYRLKLAGASFKRVLNSQIYHFQGKTNIQLAAQEEQKRQQTEIFCNQDFIRKWGEMFRYSFGSRVDPIVKAHIGQPNYQPLTGVVNITNVNEINNITRVEPFVDTLVIMVPPTLFGMLHQGIKNLIEILSKTSAMPKEYFEKKFIIINLKTKTQFEAMHEVKQIHKNITSISLLDPTLERTLQTTKQNLYRGR